jgi:hypothetical protein
MFLRNVGSAKEPHGVFIPQKSVFIHTKNEEKFLLDAFSRRNLTTELETKAAKIKVSLCLHTQQAVTSHRGGNLGHMIRNIM